LIFDNKAEGGSNKSSVESHKYITFLRESVQNKEAV